MLTIVVPVRERREIVQKFIKGNRIVLEKYPLIVVDSGGGEELKNYARTYIKKNMPFWEARKLAYSLVKTPFVLNLDSDVIVPESYIESVIEILKKEKKVGAVSIFFDRPGGHFGILEYGISLWRTEILKELYDYEKKLSPYCECFYMWRKLKRAGFRLETLPYRAKHLK